MCTRRFNNMLYRLFYIPQVPVLSAPASAVPVVTPLEGATGRAETARHARRPNDRGGAPEECPTAGVTVGRVAYSGAARHATFSSITLAAPRVVVLPVSRAAYSVELA